MPISSIFGLLLSLLCGASPLTRMVGVDSAWILGGVLTPIVAFEAACQAHARFRRGFGFSQTFKHIQLCSLRMFLLTCLVFAVYALFNTDCLTRITWFTQWVYFLMGPWMGLILAATLGSVLGLVGFKLNRPKVFASIAGCVPLFAILLSLYIFWASPGIFSYGQFYGFFPGTIYDRTVKVNTAYLLFRISTLAWIWLLFTVGANLAQTRWRLSTFASGISASLLLIFCYVHYPVWKIVASSRIIAQTLGQKIAGTYCTTHSPHELSSEHAQLLTQDCDFRVVQISRRLGVRPRRGITAYFFRSPEEKETLMGAAGTYIAKPWRNEVYLQVDALGGSKAVSSWPHPVLAHEIAHVVAAGAARGPFKVSATLHGWLPNPALIEGTAVALAWDATDGLTPHGWALALSQMKRIPPLQAAMGTRFVLFAGPQAYVWFGSFTKYLLDTYGAKKLRIAYRNGTLDVYGKPLAQLQRQWLTYLQSSYTKDRKLATDDKDWIAAWAAARFARQSIFSERCSRALEEFKVQLSNLPPSDLKRREQVCKKISKISSHDPSVDMLWFSLRLSQGDIQSAKTYLTKLQRELPAVRVDRMQEALADTSWRLGRVAEASAGYEQLLKRVAPPDIVRRLQLKHLATRAEPDEQILWRSILAPSENDPLSPVEVMHTAARLNTLRTDGLGFYLAGKQLFNEGRYASSLDALTQAHQAGVPFESFGLESLRMMATATYVLGHHQTATALWQTVASMATHQREPLRTMLILEAEDWLERIKTQTLAR